LCRALPCLGALAAASLWLSAMPVLLVLPLAVLALGYSLWLSRREQRRPLFSLQWSDSEPSVATLELAGRSQTLSGVKVLMRGPLACVWGRGADRKMRRFMWYPDTLPAAARRSLRLAGGKQIAESAPTLATMTG
jgi:toxin CptA